MEGTGVPTADGSIDVSGTGEITKGTGKFKGAHGDFTMSGNRATTGITTLAITGRSSTRSSAAVVRAFSGALIAHR